MYQRVMSRLQVLQVSQQLSWRAAAFEPQSCVCTSKDMYTYKRQLTYRQPTASPTTQCRSSPWSSHVKNMNGSCHTFECCRYLSRYNGEQLHYGGHDYFPSSKESLLFKDSSSAKDRQLQLGPSVRVLYVFSYVISYVYICIPTHKHANTYGTWLLPQHQRVVSLKRLEFCYKCVAPAWALGIFVCKCVRVCVRVYIYMYVYVYLCAFIWSCIYMYICMCIYTLACICIYIYMWKCIYIYIY